MLICKKLDVEKAVLIATPASLDLVGSVELDLLYGIDELQALEEVAGTLLGSEMLRPRLIILGIPGLVIIIILKASWHLLKFVRLMTAQGAVFAGPLELLLVKPGS